MKTQIKGILFDLDGTLADSQKDLADSTNRILKQYNYPTHPYEAYKYFVGKGMRMLATQALPESEVKEAIIEPFLKALIADYSQNCFNKTELYPGIPKLLEDLNKLNIPLVVFTNKDHDLAVTICHELLKPYNFKAISGRRDSTPRKPDPTGALQLAEQLNIAPNEMLYIGDTDTDMICANRAGMPSVGVLWGFRTEKELIENGADYIVKTPNEIIEIILGINQIKES